MEHRISRFIATSLLLAASAGASASTIWDGPATTFTLAGFTDVTQPENQDRITDNVWITRGATKGLFNAALETFYESTSPAGTQWAVGTIADGVETLTFDTWENIFGLTGPFGGPPNTVGADFVLYLTADDIYIDLQIDAWGLGSGAGGSFAYTRSTAPVVTGNGDFNGDGLVDAADYTIWRDTDGSTTDLRADANSDNVVDSLDYDIWESTYGAAAAAVAVPEPTGVAVILLAAVGMAVRTNRAARR